MKRTVSVGSYVSRTVTDCPGCGGEHPGLAFKVYGVGRPGGVDEQELAAYSYCPKTTLRIELPEAP